MPLAPSGRLVGAGVIRRKARKAREPPFLPRPKGGGGGSAQSAETVGAAAGISSGKSREFGRQAICGCPHRLDASHRSTSPSRFASEGRKVLVTRAPFPPHGPE